MTFFQFLLYFICSELILQGCVIGFLLIRRKLASRQLSTMLKQGKIKIMTQEEFLAAMAEQEKKTWN